MANIAERWGLIPDLRSFCAAAKPVWGTCAGLIFLADRATGAIQGPCTLCTLPLSVVKVGGAAAKVPSACGHFAGMALQCLAVRSLSDTPSACSQIRQFRHSISGWPHDERRRCGRREAGRAGAAGGSRLSGAAQLLWRADQQLRDAYALPAVLPGGRRRRQRRRVGTLPRRLHQVGCFARWVVKCRMRVPLWCRSTFARTLQQRPASCKFEEGAAISSHKEFCPEGVSVGVAERLVSWSAALAWRSSQVNLQSCI